LRLDLVGHGSSSVPTDAERYAFGAVVQQILSVLDHVGAQRVDAMGYSMGGRILYHALLKAPDRFASAATLGAHPGLEDRNERASRRQRDDAWINLLEAGQMGRFVDRWLDQPIMRSLTTVEGSFLRAIRQRKRQQDAQGLALTMRAMGLANQEPLAWELARLETPILLLAGQRDEKFLAINEALADRLQHARTAVVAGAGHPAHLEAPEATARTLINRLGSSPDQDATARPESAP
jgi:2-succinyl-6-hydroxy-2,4-cyclohexadiene-1-carboxylate synthase